MTTNPHEKMIKMKAQAGLTQWQHQQQPHRQFSKIVCGLIFLFSFLG
jgi:hypothetical protein